MISDFKKGIERDPKHISREILKYNGQKGPCFIMAPSNMPLRFTSAAICSGIISPLAVCILCFLFLTASVCTVLFCSPVFQLGLNGPTVLCLLSLVKSCRQTVPGLSGAWDCAKPAELQYYSFTIESCYHSVWLVTLCEKLGCMCLCAYKYWTGTQCGLCIFCLDLTLINKNSNADFSFTLTRI